MEKVKKTLGIVSIIVLTLLAFYLFNLLNTSYPNNIFNRILNGALIVLVPGMIALIIAYLVDPFKEKLMTKFKMNRVLAVSVTLLISVITIVGFVGFIGYFIYQQSILLYDSLKGSNFLLEIKTWAINNGLEKVYLKIEDYVNNFDFLSLLGSGSNIFSTLSKTLTTMILVPIFLWYLLYEKEVIFTSIVKVFPEKYHNDIINVGKEANTVTVAYFKSKIVSMMFLFVVFLFVFLGFGLPVGYVIMFALLISVLDLVPYLGPTIGMLVPIIYIFANQGVNFFYNQNLHAVPIAAVLILLGLNTIIQAIQGNIVMPKLAGKSMKINPFLILVSMLFFGNILGVWGVVLAIPICGILIVIVNYMRQMNKEPIKVIRKKRQAAKKGELEESNQSE